MQSSFSAHRSPTTSQPRYWCAAGVSISKLFTLAIALGLAGFLGASDPVDSAVTRLAQVKMFAFGGVGFAGVVSQGEKDYYLILSKPSAGADFEKVFAGGSQEAKAYALVGLHRVDVERFKSLAGPMRTSSESIQTAQGCLLSKRTMADLIKGIEAGQYAILRK